MRVIGLAVHGGNPALVLIGVAVEPAVAEVFPEEAEFPEVVGDVFADVTYGAVGADDYFLILFSDFRLGICGPLGDLCFCDSCPPHYPAALVLPLSFIEEHAAIFELLESGIPEMQVQNLAFARK